jgi:uncharacterized protein DUF4386
MTEAAVALDDGATKVRRVTGLLLLLTALTMMLAVVLSDPAIEEHHVGKLFIQQVERAADRVPAIYVFQVVDVVRGFLTAAVGVGLYLMLRGGRTPSLGLAGLVMFAMSGVFAAGTAFVGAGTTNAAQLYVGGHLEGIGAGSTDLLAMIQVFTVLHFGFFLTAFAALGIGIAVFSRSLAWSQAVPRWLAWLGLTSGTLLCSSWLTFINELLFIPFFIGGVLSLVWLITIGIRLAKPAISQ